MLRTWYGFEEKAAAFAACADYAHQRYGLTPVFLSLNIFHDSSAAQKVVPYMKAPYHIWMTEQNPSCSSGCWGAWMWWSPCGCTG